MVLGKRGATVSQLRQETGAAIKVLALDGLAYPESEWPCVSVSESTCFLRS